MNVAERIRLIRVSMNLRPCDLARRTGYSRAYIAIIEWGRSAPSIETLQKVLKAMDISLYQFFYDGKNSRLSENGLSTANPSWVEVDSAAVVPKHMLRAKSPLSYRLGRRLCSIRKERSLTRRDLAFITDFAPSAISRIEVGRTMPRVGTLEKLARALDFPLCDLFAQCDCSEPYLTGGPHSKNSSVAGPATESLVPQPTTMTVGERIRQLRKSLNWTQADLEDRTGIAESYISTLENSHWNPTLMTLRKLSLAFEIPMTQLFCNSQNGEVEIALAPRAPRSHFIPSPTGQNWTN